MMNAKISVVLATFNGEKFIEAQISSILPQLGAQDEVIISDDGSTDSTLKIIQNLNDNRIAIHHNKSRKGTTGNFENGLKKASGDFIFLADQDDIWHPNKVKVVLKTLEAAECVLHNAELVNEFGEKLNQDLFSIYKSRTGLVRNFVRNTFVGCCMAFRRTVLLKALPIPAKVDMHDMWIALISEKNYSTKLISEPLISYRRHSSNASTTGQKSEYPLHYQISYRLHMLRYLFFR